MNDVRVLGAVETMQHHRTWIQTARGGFPIHFVFEPIAEPFIFIQSWATHARWRHHTGAKFANNFLPQLRMISRSREIQFFETEIRPLELVAMTRHAILIQKR